MRWHDPSAQIGLNRKYSTNGINQLVPNFGGRGLMGRDAKGDTVTSNKHTVIELS